MLRHSLIFALAALATAVSAEPDLINPPLRLITAGVNCPQGGGEIQSSPGTVDGEVIRRDVSRIAFDVAGRTVPAEIGLTFGFHLATDGFPIPLVASVTHPPMGAHNVTSQTWPLPFQREHMIGYTFEDDWELRPGTWTFSIHFQETLLFRADYTVTSTGTLDKVQTVCFGRKGGV